LAKNVAHGNWSEEPRLINDYPSDIYRTSIFPYNGDYFSSPKGLFHKKKKKKYEDREPFLPPFYHHFLIYFGRFLFFSSLPGLRVLG
jgi:hypothetical protein